MKSRKKHSGNRVCMVPYSGENPYQRKLVGSLRDQGWRICVRSPFTSLRGLVRRRRRDPESLALLHVHWLPKFGANRLIFSWLGFAVRLKALSRAGVRIVWTVHDLYDPESRWRSMDRRLARFVFNHSDSVIVHSKAAMAQVAREFSTPDTAKMHVIPHANYLGCYANSVTRDEASTRLGIAGDELAFLFFGEIRTYKGVPDLVDAFSRLPAGKTRLLIAGRPWVDGLMAKIEEAAARFPGIDLRVGFVKDEDIQVYMNAVDAVVLPYREYLTSGAVVLAMSYGKACVVPNVGSMCEVVHPEGAVFYDAEAKDGLLGALKECERRRAELPEMGGRNLEEIKAWTWERMAKDTGAVYETTLAVE